jgi:hypothetical protein
LSNRQCRYPAGEEGLELPEDATLAERYLFEILALMRDAGSWVPKKPETTIYSFGQDIQGMALPAETWTKVFTLEEEYGPYVVYWKTLTADSPQIICRPTINGSPASPNGIDLRDLYNYGVWQANDNIWCHIYDNVNDRYGLTFNIIEPVVEGAYEFYIRNADTTAHTLTYLYLKWYQWSKGRHLKVGE